MCPINVMKYIKGQSAKARSDQNYTIYKYSKQIYKYRTFKNYRKPVYKSYNKIT